MSRAARFTLIAVVAALVTPQLAAAEPSTIRIETRPFYGATITKEEGVRVFRPLPPTSTMIINPDGRTPLNLNIDEGRASRTHNGPALDFLGYDKHGYPIFRGYLDEAALGLAKRQVRTPYGMIKRVPSESGDSKR